MLSFTLIYVAPAYDAVEHEVQVYNLGFPGQP
jgi:hypothetical protein